MVVDASIEIKDGVAKDGGKAMVLVFVVNEPPCVDVAIEVLWPLDYAVVSQVSYKTLINCKLVFRMLLHVPRSSSHSTFANSARSPANNVLAAMAMN